MGMLRSCLGMVLGAWLWVALLEQGVGPGDPRGASSLNQPGIFMVTTEAAVSGAGCTGGIGSEPDVLLGHRGSPRHCSRTAAL